MFYLHPLKMFISSDMFLQMDSLEGVYEHHLDLI